MKKIGIGVVGGIIGVMSAALIGFAGPAQAAVDVHDVVSLSPGSGVYDNDSNYPWRDQLFPRVKVPRVDTSVRN